VTVPAIAAASQARSKQPNGDEELPADPLAPSSQVISGCLTAFRVSPIVWNSLIPQMKQFIYAYVAPEGSGFQAQCFDPPLTVHASSLERAIDEVRETIRVQLGSDNLHKMGFAPQPRLVTTFFLAPLKLSR